VIRSIESGYGYGCGYGQMSDPQGMPLTGNVPWGTTGHAANRHCPLKPAPAPVTSPPGVEWKEPSGSAESVCVCFSVVRFGTKKTLLDLESEA
jgi:hypothetical protein